MNEDTGVHYVTPWEIGKEIGGFIGVGQVIMQEFRSSIFPRGHCGGSGCMALGCTFQTQTRGTKSTQKGEREREL